GEGRAHLSQLMLLRLPELRRALPEKYYGNPEGCRSFLLQCELYFRDEHCTDYEKVTTIITFLTGRALEWAMALWDSRGVPRPWRRTGWE
uniref:DUF4939 domain-containing protein n=1 Tax=Esox lucius TaxID=8010 RepID=A0A3P8ZTN1_ESOLU